MIADHKAAWRITSMLPILLFFGALVVSGNTLQKAFNAHPGAFVLIDCAAGETFCSDAAACAEKLPPCSTFKIGIRQ
jgi:beta-lactamase class D